MRPSGVNRSRGPLKRSPGVLKKDPGVALRVGGGEAEGGFRDDLGGTLGRLENPLGIPRDRADGLGTA